MRTLAFVPACRMDPPPGALPPIRMPAWWIVRIGVRRGGGELPPDCRLPLDRPAFQRCTGGADRKRPPSSDRWQTDAVPDSVKRGLPGAENARPQERRPSLTAPARGGVIAMRVGTKKRPSDRTKKLTER